MTVSNIPESSFQSILERITDAFFALDTDWNFTYVNREASRLLLKNRDDLVGKSIWHEFPEAVASTFYEKYHRAINEQIPIQFDEFYPPLNTWFDVRAYPSGDGLSVYFRDITGQKKAQSTGEQHYKSLFDQNPNAVYSLGVDGKIQSANRALMELTGYSLEELVEMNHTSFPVAEDLDRRVAYFHEALKGNPQTYEMEITHKDGSRIHVNVTNLPIVVDDQIIGVYGIAKNITRRIKTQERLRKSESSLAYAQRLAHLGSWDWDVQQNLLNFSEECCRIFGVSVDEAPVSFEEYLQLIQPSDRNIVIEAIRQSWEGKPYDVEYTLIRPNGEERVVNAQAEVFFEGGRAVGMVGALLDITERKHAERLLRESEKQFRLITENSLDMIMKTNADDIPTYVSPACRTLLGYEPEELVGVPAFHLYHPADVVKMKTYHSAALKGLKTFTQPYRLRRKYGGYIWVETTVQAILDEHTGEMREYISIVRDVSERVRQQEEIAQLSNRNKMILDSVAEGIYGLDMERRIVFCNPSAARMLGFEIEELIGRNPAEVFRLHSNPDPQLFYQELKEKILYENVEEIFYRKDGTSFPVELVAVPINKEGTVVGVVLTFNDITERKEAARREEERLLIETELSLAASVQQFLLPDIEQLQYSPGTEVGVVSVPARVLNGDFYNFATHGRNFIAAVADISGKGIPAATLMSMMKFAMDEFALQGERPDGILNMLNRYVDKYTDTSMFVTMFIGSYDTETGNFYYCSAGHEPALLYKAAEGRFEELATDGSVLGLFDGFKYHAKAVKLEPGDMVLMYTDGIIETKERERAETYDILKTLLRQIPRSASTQAMVEQIYQSMQDWHNGKIMDDQTLLLFRRLM